MPQKLDCMNIERAVQDVRMDSSECGANIHAECVPMAACVIRNRLSVNARPGGPGLRAANRVLRSVHLID